MNESNELNLSGPERSYLRGLAHPLKPVVMVGQAGLTEQVVRQVGEALLAHELIKVKLQKPEAKSEMAEELASRTGAALCGLVGHTVILYRPHPENPRIVVRKK